MTQDRRIIDRIRKLLALAGDAGATEAEAELASAKAAELMEEHGLEIAAIELAGGEGEKRDGSVTGVAGLAREKWAERLMEAVSETCFCDARPVTNLHNGKSRLTGFSVIGRHSAVVGCVQLFEYLSRTTIRLSRKEFDSQRLFRFGCSERLAERLRTRHEHRLAEQRREQEQRQRDAQARGTGKELMVVLEDYAQRERAYNADHRYNLPPGTTLARREASIAKQRERDAKIKELTDSGIPWDIAWWMANGKTREEAEAIEAKSAKASGRAYRSYVDFDARRRESASYHRGRGAGDNVGLDDQLADKQQGKLR